MTTENENHIPEPGDLTVGAWTTSEDKKKAAAKAIACVGTGADGVWSLMLVASTDGRYAVRWGDRARLDSGASPYLVYARVAAESLARCVVREEVERRKREAKARVVEWQLEQARERVAALEARSTGPAPTTARRLMRARVTSGLTWTAIGNTLGVGGKTVAKWANGRTHPTGQRAERLEQWLEAEERRAG